MNKASTTYIHDQILAAVRACKDAADLKIVVAPENHPALALRTALARQGTPLINIEAVTPVGLARHIWRAVHPGDGFRELSRTVAEFVLGVLVEDLDSAAAPLLGSSISTVYDSIQGDKQRARSPEELRSAATTPVQEAYAEAYTRYLDFLAEHGRMDDIDIQKAARLAVKEFASQRHVGLVVLSDMVDLTDAEYELVSELGGLSGRRFLFGSGVHKGANLPAWAYSLPFVRSQDAAAPRTMVRATRREEVRSVLADVLNGETAFDEVEIALTDEKLYLGEVASACERFGIPWQTSSKSSSTDPRLVALVRSHADWVKSGYDTSHLARMVRNQLLDVSKMEERPGDIASALDAFPVGMATMRRPEVRAVMSEKADGRGVGRAQLAALHSFIDVASRFVLPARLSVSAYADSFASLTEMLAAHIAPREEVIAFWEKQFPFSRDARLPSASSSWIAQRVLKGLSGVNSSHSSGLMVLPLKDAGYGSARSVYVLGLDDQASADSAASRSQDPSIIPAGEESVARTPISNRLLVKELSRRYEARLVLCAPSYDVGSGRPLFPGSALIDQSNIKKLQPELRTEWLDQTDFLAGTRDPRVLDVFETLGFGNAAEGQRNSDTWTEFDGVLQVPSAWRMESSSPSKLEKLASCPFRFFLMHVLQLDVPQPQTEEWITKREEGELLHSLFEAHAKEQMESGSESWEADESRLLAQLDGALRKAALLAEGGSDALLERKLRNMGVSVALYLKRERDNASSRRPVAVELSFGGRRSGDRPPYIIPLTRGDLSLSGRLDRMDQTDDGAFVITDFKTGKFKGYAPKELKKLTDQLQWAIYALAIASDGSQVEAFEYFFPSVQGAGLVRRVGAPARDEMIPILEDLSLRYDTGAFVQAAGASICTYCDFKDVCGDLPARKRVLTDKFMSPQDQLTDVFANWNYRSGMKVGK